MFNGFFFLVYTMLGIHLLETVAKPMLQMLEIQRESSTKRIQNLQAILEQLSIGINDDTYYCEGNNKNNVSQENVPILTTYRPNQSKSSSMVSSPV